MSHPDNAWLDRVQSLDGPLLAASGFLLHWGADRFTTNRLASRLACALGVFLMRLDRALWSAFRV